MSLCQIIASADASHRHWQVCAILPALPLGVERMTPLRFSHIWEAGRRFAAWMLLCFCVLGLLAVGYGQPKTVVRKVDQVGALISNLKAPKAITRAAAAEALGKIGDRRAVEPLILALTDKDWGVRLNAAVALGEIGDARALGPLSVALKDSDHDVRTWAAQALYKIHNPTEESDWADAIRSATPESYIAFHAKYPNSEQLTVRTGAIKWSPQQFGRDFDDPLGYILEGVTIGDFSVSVTMKEAALLGVIKLRDNGNGTTTAVMGGVNPPSNATVLFKDGKIVACQCN
jgi:hypothetical protein